MMDKLFDRCDRYDIKIVFVLNWLNMFGKRTCRQGWASDDETLYIWYTETAYQGRTNKYLDEFIATWQENHFDGNLNEGITRMLARQSKSYIPLLQLSSFIHATEKTHDIDPKVVMEDSALRTAQWTLKSDGRWFIIQLDHWYPWRKT